MLKLNTTPETGIKIQNQKWWRTTENMFQGSKQAQWKKGINVQNQMISL